MRYLFLITLLLGAADSAFADRFSGRFASHIDGENLMLAIEPSSGGSYRGTITGAGEAVALFARRRGESLIGEFDENGDRWSFVAHLLEDGSIRIQDEDGEVIIFQPVSSRVAQATQDRTPYWQERNTDPVSSNAYPPLQSTTGVTINRRPLDAQKRAALEQAHQIRIADGSYWYDSRSGAWGLEDGPTVGFIAAGLNLPGPMPADISGGGTGIFINGREIHPTDQLGLQQLFGITYQGHYWLDAAGNLGRLGGPQIANVVSAIRANQQRQTAGGSVNHGYGSAYGSRGTLSGGMYSGRTASGKSIFYYPGM